MVELVIMDEDGTAKLLYMSQCNAVTIVLIFVDAVQTTTARSFGDKNISIVGMAILIIDHCR